MKTKFMKLSGLMMIAMVLLVTVSMSSCNKKSSGESLSTPVDVTNPLTESVYYVSGAVVSGGVGVEGVTVTTGSLSTTTASDGTYNLTLSSKANASVTFSKSGYVTVAATAVFESSATSGATVILSQEMTKSVEAQKVTAGEAVVLEFAQSTGSEDEAVSETIVTISIPATAVTEDVAISATVFIPALEESVAEVVTNAIEKIEEDSEEEVTVAVSSTFVALDLQPDGTTFDDYITISIPVESTSSYFTNVDHVKYNETTGAWDYQGKATYNNGAYYITVDGFSQHGVQTDSNVAMSKSSMTIASEEYDNLGNMSAITGTLNYTQLSGWEVVSGSSSDLYSEMVKYIVNFLGTYEGEIDIPASRDVAVSGDEKFSVIVTQSVVTYVFSFDTSRGTESVKVNSYGSVSIASKTEQGDLRNDHNF